MDISPEHCEMPEIQVSTETTSSNIITTIQISNHDQETNVNVNASERNIDCEEIYISSYLASHPEFSKEWFLKNATNDYIQEWMNLHGGHRTPISCESWSLKSEGQQHDEDLLTASYAEIARGGRNSVTSELFNDIVLGVSSRKRKISSTTSNDERLTRNQLRDQFEKLDEHELFMQLIRDITNELDIDTLCHKILVNVSILTNSDRGSLFLAKGSRDDRYLVPKLFDVTPDSLLQEALQAAEQYGRISPIPFGTGIAGHVALTKETVNIKDAYQDSRFNKEIDSRTGYHTKSIMCMPILNFGGDVIGVAQCINKITDSDENWFSKQDEQVFQKYLTFCGIGIQNAQLFEMSVSEYKRNQLLLSLARSIFEETTSLDGLINKIMIKAQGLLQSEKCRVYLVDTERQEIEEAYHERLKSPLPITSSITSNPRKFSRPEDVIFSSIFELQTGKNEITKLSLTDLLSQNNALHLQYARQVASSGQTLNCSELGSGDININTLSPKDNNLCGNSAIDRVLSVPVFNSENKVIGVAQLVNKNKGEQFTEVDITTLEAFSIFCGLGIYNSLMYEKALKLTAKQKVALEVLSYHASSSLDETKKLMNLTIPPAEKFNLYSFQFCDFSLEERDTCLVAIRMFLDLKLINNFKIPYQVLCRWVLSVKKNYRRVIYHNWRHALNVTQTMFAMLTTGQMGSMMTDLEQLSLIVASMCHDLDHRGTNNSFQAKSGSPLATLYGTSIMENHHFNHCILILNSEGNNILQSLSPEEFKIAIQIIESSILSTDLAQYFKKKDKFEELVAAGESEWTDPNKKDILRGMMMTACDVSAICKPWEIQRKIADLVASEFFQQGDLEKNELKEKPIAMMDRERKDEFPLMQVGFIDSICLPVYKILSQCWSNLEPLYKSCYENRNRWFNLAQESCSLALAQLDPSLKSLLVGCQDNRKKWENFVEAHQRWKEPNFSQLQMSTSLDNLSYHNKTNIINTVIRSFSTGRRIDTNEYNFLTSQEILTQDYLKNKTSNRKCAKYCILL